MTKLKPHLKGFVEEEDLEGLREFLKSHADADQIDPEQLKLLHEEICERDLPIEWNELICSHIALTEEVWQLLMCWDKPIGELLHIAGQNVTSEHFRFMRERTYGMPTMQRSILEYGSFTPEELNEALRKGVADKDFLLVYFLIQVGADSKTAIETYGEDLSVQFNEHGDTEAACTWSVLNGGKLPVPPLKKKK